MSSANLRYFGVTALAGLLTLAAIASSQFPQIDADLAESLLQSCGPVAVVGLVALGIVISPIPSGVIALAAGAMYGTVLGGLLTISGALLGAACAFGLSRYFGRGAIASSQSIFAKALTRERSQTGLMAIVFVTRLIPFISFDAISYLAGLTPLRFWRFAVATGIGTAPVCFAFAAAGDTTTTVAINPAVLAGMCGITLLVPIGLLLGKKFAMAHLMARSTPEI